MRSFQMAIAVDHHHGFKPFIRAQRCKFRSFTQQNSSELELGQTKFTYSLNQAVTDTYFHRSFSTPCLSLSTKVEEEANISPMVEIVGGLSAPRVRALVVETVIAMASGVSPVPVSSGLGGAYYLCSRNGDKIAVAKPIDEEPLAINNPKGFAGRVLGQPGLKSGVRIGETGVREVAAYLLDHDGFTGVPPTALVKISQVAFHVNHSSALAAPLPKIASLQRFVDHDFDAGDLGPSGFSVTSIHRIGILDIRLLNLDRHAGNMLVKKHGRGNSNNGHGGCGNYAIEYAELVPIDHGLCLPEWLDDPYFEWLHWPQASLPFSEPEAKYISSLDPLKDAELLRSELPLLREPSIRVLVLCTIFLKRAAAAGLCLSKIGGMMTREFCGREEGSSILETLCAKAKATMNNVFEYNHDKEETKEEMDIFQFDIECADNCTEILDIPQLLHSHPEMGKPPKIPKNIPSTRSMSGFPDRVLSPLDKEEDDNNDDDDPKVGGLTKSVSFSVTNNNNESEGISFKDMSEEEWGLFLESFEKLLPKAFEGTKSMGLKQRLGTSCKF
ncbi:hypothetical protein HHK36_011663 [Tetracentron sinense]|uniref:1-phosphatidylinositol 4-kinase n=1 Tax=Tetracentron sinense TaxID=13715 RepID=A0A834Z9W0_TETSI|nr:hypothetical protein HHK36_011663 [Tetracentron sinense]